jgi:glycosyltransferase involved in cell wall biosynthesis
MSPIVSVIILSYNQEKYISQAIDSILLQKTEFNYEILVGDDHSSDGSVKIIEQYAREHKTVVRSFINTENLGSLKNEYNLIKKAKGKYIAFLEADDYWVDEQKMQKQVSFLENNSDFGLVHADVNHLDEQTGILLPHVNKSSKLKVPEGDIFQFLISPNPFFIKTATTCFRKKIIDDHFNYQIAISENWPLTDLALWLDISRNSKVHYFHEVHATYRLLKESASRTNSHRKKLYFHRGLLNIKLHYLRKYNCSSAAESAIFEEHNRALLRIGFRLNDNTITETAYHYLISNKLPLSIKERLMVYGNRNVVLHRILNLKYIN